MASKVSAENLKKWFDFCWFERRLFFE
jgi:hypothetical protein